MATTVNPRNAPLKALALLPGVGPVLFHKDDNKVRKQLAANMIVRPKRLSYIYLVLLPSGQTRESHSAVAAAITAASIVSAATWPGIPANPKNAFKPASAPHIWSLCTYAFDAT